MHNKTDEYRSSSFSPRRHRGNSSKPQGARPSASAYSAAVRAVVSANGASSTLLGPRVQRADDLIPLRQQHCSEHERAATAYLKGRNRVNILVYNSNFLLSGERAFHVESVEKDTSLQALLDLVLSSVETGGRGGYGGREKLSKGVEQREAWFLLDNGWKRGADSDIKLQGSLVGRTRRDFKSGLYQWEVDGGRVPVVSSFGIWARC